MKLYKVRAWVNHTVKRGRNKGHIEHPYFKEEVFTKLNGALSVFRACVNEIQSYDMYGDEPHVELFVPHIYEDGHLAYWPDDEKYIAKYPE